jgi:hypothetical protein
MTDREKLIARLNASFEMQYRKRGLLTAQHTADDLISYGVTFAKDTNVPDKNVGTWIPVSERLPDTFGTFLVAVRIPTRKRTYSDSADFDPFTKKWTPSLFWGKGMNVTHWMPLPEPPKEE